MIIYAKLADKVVNKMTVEPLTSITEVRKQIEAALIKKGVRFESLLLLYSGKTLVDDHNVFQYNIKHECTIVVMVRGAPPSPPPNTEGDILSASESTPAKIDNEGSTMTRPQDKDEIQTDPTLKEQELLARLHADAVQNNCKRCQKNPFSKCVECGCCVCGGKDDDERTLICDECNRYYHIYCHDPPLDRIPEDAWFCNSCYNDPNEIVGAGQKLDLSQSRKAKMPSAKQIKKWGGGMACAGTTKKCTIVDVDHIGSIPGVPVGSSWLYRIGCSEAGVHRPPVGGIAGKSSKPAVSIVMSAGYPEDTDNGDEFIYTGSGGNDLSGNKRTAKSQSFDQELTRSNLSLARTCNARINDKVGATAIDWRKSTPVRVVRSAKLAKHNPKYAPLRGLRYDGCYKLVKYWPEIGVSGHRVWRYLFRRDDAEPAPWTPEGQAYIKGLGLKMEVPEGYEDKDEAMKTEGTAKKGGSRTPKKRRAKGGEVSEQTGNSDSNSKNKRRHVAGGNDAALQSVSVVIQKRYIPSSDVLEIIRLDKANRRSWESLLSKKPVTMQEFLRLMAEEDFMCPVCQDLVKEPVTTECGHNVCLVCLRRSIKSFGPRCPLCRSDISNIVVGGDIGTPKLLVNHFLVCAIKGLIPSYKIDPANLPCPPNQTECANKSGK